MKFESFKADFEVKNNYLKLALIVSSILFSVSIFMIATQRRYFLYSGGEIFKNAPLSVEVCRLGFIGITNGEPNPYVITEGIMDLIKKDPFLIQIDEVVALKTINEGQCKIIFKSNHELLAFKITLDKDDSYPFIYKLAQIDELAPRDEL